MTYGKRLQQAMDAAKVDRKTLARELGVTVHALGMVITGGGRAERWLSRVNNQAAAKFLRVDSNWLFTGEGAPEGQPVIPYTGPSSLGRELALVFDMIPESEPLKRAKAYALATSAIVAVLQGENVALQRESDK
jgi:transcriptional regulator with XRE-family HTH domain